MAQERGPTNGYRDKVALKARDYGEIESTQVGKMKELIEYIAKSIVNAPDEVVVEEVPGDQGIILRLQVALEDKGRVIGKQGRVAQAMRTLLRVIAAKQGTKATLEIT